MSASNDQYEFRIRKRPWWYWSIGIIWLVAVFFAVETAMASRAELEPQAAMISLVIAGLLLAVGAAGYIIERRKAAQGS
jgi:hypothetical protein